MPAPVNIAVHGIGGHVCSVEANDEWTIGQVQEIIFQKLQIPMNRQTLLNGTNKLAVEALISNLIPDSAASAELALTLVIRQAPQGLVNFVECGLEHPMPGHLVRSELGLGYNATAVSCDGFPVVAGGGLSFSAAEVGQLIMLGLGGRSAPPEDFRSIDFAVGCRPGGVFGVYQRGIHKFTSERTMGPNSLAEIRVNEKVEFVLDSHVEFTCALQGQQTLYAMASFNGAGAEAVDIRWL